MRQEVSLSILKETCNYILVQPSLLLFIGRSLIYTTYIMAGNRAVSTDVRENMQQAYDVESGKKIASVCIQEIF